MERSLPKSALVIASAPPDDEHDPDFVRLRLLEVLYDLGGVRTEVAPDYGDQEAIDQAGMLVTYIARRSPDAAQCEAVRRFLERGGRWFALHASNAVGRGCDLPSLLGSRFLSHPPYGRFAVSLTAPGDPLLDGIEPFEVEDELYVMEASDDIEVLLHAHWSEAGPDGSSNEEEIRPLMYRRRVGAGEVLYLALGHCNRAGAVVAGQVVPNRAGSWGWPAFNKLVRRGLEWAARRE